LTSPRARCWPEKLVIWKDAGGIASELSAFDATGKRGFVSQAATASPLGGSRPDLSQIPAQCRLMAMSTVAEIKAAISRLTLEERAEVARCLHEWEDDAWDKQIQQDLAAGKLEALLAKVDDDIEQGKLRDSP